MHIHKPLTPPNHANTLVHRVASVTVTNPPGGLGAVSLTVNSYVNDDPTAQIAWQETVWMPLEVFEGGKYPENVIEFLTSSEGYLAGGVVHDDFRSDIDIQKMLLCQRVNQLRDQFIHRGMLLEGIGFFDTSEASIRNIQNQSLRASVAIQRGEAEGTIPFRLMDNTTVVLTHNQMIDVGLALNAFINGFYEFGWFLKGAIESCPTIEDLTSIDIYSNWP